jgi:hypothetical protein
MQALDGFNLRRFSIYCANAKLAKVAKKANPMQLAVLATHAEALEFVKDNSMAMSSLIAASSVTVDLENGFKSSVFELKGKYLNADTLTIHEVSLWDYITTKQNMLTAAYLIGHPGAGKTTLIRAMGREFCAQMEVEKFIMTSDYDQLGTLSRSNLTSCVGMYAFDDAPFTTCKDQPLTPIDFINIHSTTTLRSYPARYAPAQLYPRIPVVTALNAGTGPDGKEDPGYYFEKGDMYGLAALARDDAKYLKQKASQRDIAVTRRAVIFVVPAGHLLFKQEARETLRGELDNIMKERMARSSLKRPRGESESIIQQLLR